MVPRKKRRRKKLPRQSQNGIARGRYILGVPGDERGYEKSKKQNLHGVAKLLLGKRKCSAEKKRSRSDRLFEEGNIIA